MKIITLLAIWVCIVLSSCSSGEFYETKKFDQTYYVIDTNLLVKPKIIKKNDLNYEVSEYYNENEKFPYLVENEFKGNNDTIYISNYFYPNSKNIKVYKKTIINKKIIIDSCKVYYENGKLKREAILENFNIVYDKNYDSIGKIITYSEKKEFFIEPNVKIKSIASCITYPENLRRKNCEAKVLLKCYVNNQGEIEKIMYDSEHYEGFLKEAIKCVLSNKVEPGMISDIPTDFWVTIPISFRLR